jgi:hypothetical protein
MMRLLSRTSVLATSVTVLLVKPAHRDVVTPHASFLALDGAAAGSRSLYPGVYGADGFFDSVDPVTGAVGHHYLVLDQSMIMAALDNALNNRALQGDFASDPVSWAART